MRIGHYSFEPWAPGGISSYIRRLTLAQRERGDEVVLLSRDRPEENIQEPDFHVVGGGGREVFSTAEILNLDVLHLHRPVTELPSSHLPTVRTMHGNQGSCPAGSRFLQRTEHPCNRTPGTATCLWGHLVDHCGSRRPHNIRANFSNFELEQSLSKRLPTMTVSQFVRDAMIQAGSPSDNLHVVHSPAPSLPGPFRPPPRDGVPRFAFVGRIEPNKGVEWFLRAAARCDAPFRVDLAGTGSEWYGDFIRRRIDELGLSARVTVHGWLSEAEVQAVYQRARAVVVPSLWHEPAGLVTLEAGASGRAVIVSRVGGIPEYADSSFALMCDPGDVEAMANHLSSLTNDWDTARTMGEAGYDTMRRRFTLNEFLARVDDVYAVARDRFAADRSSRTASSTQV